MLVHAVYVDFDFEPTCEELCFYYCSIICFIEFDLKTSTPQVYQHFKKRKGFLSFLRLLEKIIGMILFDETAL